MDAGHERLAVGGNTHRVTAGGPPSLDVFSIYSPRAGSTRVRVYDWLAHLGWDAREHQYAGLPDAGMTTLAHHGSAVARAERDVRRHDPRGQTVLLTREASPLSRGGVESRLLGDAAHGVYDIDDAMFHAASLHRRAFGGARKFERAAAAADVVIAGNDYLADWASGFARDVRVIPSCVQPRDYDVAPCAVARSEHPVMVWLGSRTTEQFLVPLLPQLVEVHERTGARLRLISAAADNPTLASAAHMIDRVAWRIETFAEHLAGADVALAPLDDSPFARGKCAYKILQYGAARLRVVGSPVGANAAALERLGGVAVTRSDEWADAVVAVLQESDDDRVRLGAQARAAVQEHYSFEAWSNTWTAALAGAPRTRHEPSGDGVSA